MIRELAHALQGALRRQHELAAESTKVSAMDAKAREALIVEALDSSTAGAEALAALKRMRVEIK